MSALADVLPALEKRLGALEGEPEPLDGGITNRNLRARFAGRDVVVRLCGKDTTVLGIDRGAEVSATRAAHALGIGPEVLAFLPGEEVIVTAFVPGRALDEAALRAPGMLERVAPALHAFHAGAPLGHRFDAFRIVESYRDGALARGGEIPADWDAAAALAARIEPALRAGAAPAVPCHNDLLAGNLLALEDGGVRIVDWEYAADGDACFDLAHLAGNGFDRDDEERLLTAYFGSAPTAAQLARLRLMRPMAALREAMWGVVQAVASDLDVDYHGYAAGHFATVHAAAADPELERLLADVSAG